MTEQERIEQLKSVPPRPPMTRGQKIVQAISWLCSAIAVASMCVAVYATQRAWHTASCVNSILGDRAQTTQIDSRAHAEWARSLATLLAAPHEKQAAMVAGFVADTTQYAHTLAADQAFRDAHPLGRC